MTRGEQSAYATVNSFCELPRARPAEPARWLAMTKADARFSGVRPSHRDAVQFMHICAHALLRTNSTPIRPRWICRIRASATHGLRIAESAPHSHPVAHPRRHAEDFLYADDRVVWESSLAQSARTPFSKPTHRISPSNFARKHALNGHFHSAYW